MAVSTDIDAIWDLWECILNDTCLQTQRGSMVSIYAMTKSVAIPAVDIPAGPFSSSDRAKKVSSLMAERVAGLSLRRSEEHRKSVHPARKDRCQHAFSKQG